MFYKAPRNGLLLVPVRSLRCPFAQACGAFQNTTGWWFHTVVSKGPIGNPQTSERYYLPKINIYIITYPNHSKSVCWPCWIWLFWGYRLHIYIYINTHVFCCGYPNHHPYFFWTVDTTNQATVEVVSPLKRSLLRFARHVASLKSRSLGLGISLYHWLSTTPYNTCFLTIANTIRVYNFPTSGSETATLLPHILDFYSQVAQVWQTVAGILTYGDAPCWNI